MFNIYCILCRHYDKYGESSDQTIRDNFNIINKKAMKLAFKNKTDIELTLILCKIYLYLGHLYMDIHYYDRSTCLAQKCCNLYNDIEESTSHCTEVNSQ